MGIGMKFKDVNEGDTLIADGGFTCIDEGRCLLVENSGGGLFIACDEGRHFLDGQIDLKDGETLVGLTLYRG